MNTADNLDEWGADPLEPVEVETDTSRFSEELEQVRAALTKSFEQSLARLRETKWVPFDSVSRMVEELSSAADKERARADALEADLDEAKREIENVRALCELSVTAAQEAAMREQEEAAANFTRELDAAREQARAASAAEARLRQELAAVQARSQEIVDAQMLQLVEFKRELEQSANAKAERARAEASSRKESEAPRKEPVVRAIEPLPIPASSLPLGHGRSALAPEFAAIEAVLAGSPPVVSWQRAD